MAHITMKKALATPCKVCGVRPKLSDDYLYNGGLCLIYCPVCRAESLAGCRIHHATDTWYEMNKGAKNTEQQVQPENGPVKCANNGCAGWDNGFCAMPGLCREWAVSG